MNALAKTSAAAATLALMLPGAALANNGHGNGHANNPASPSGKAGAPGQVCKSLKVHGKKTAEQRAAYKKCIHDAVAKRQAVHAAQQGTEGTDDNAAEKPETGDDNAVEKPDTGDDNAVEKPDTDD